ncbi:MAG: DUF4416 family protein [Planctomycetota bacterium]|nr:DUF4416 family protein [Planctomycetota bacterium]MDA1177816.1 DUF4416 family protein [Planctomycetota bacterium]
MGSTSQHEPVVLILAAFSRHGDALDWARQRAEREWGPVEHVSARFEFRETNYYASSMGPDLLKTFLTFRQRFDPADLPTVKNLTNTWEREFAATSPCTELRPLNLDPGYLSQAKLVLASTKDHAHRIYLSQGIYAEITLCYRGRTWQQQPWTYPDYQRPDYHEFFTQCRQTLRGES